MFIRGKDLIKLAAIAVVTCCAVFVCTLFLNYMQDLADVGGEIASEAGRILYEAQMSMGKVTCAVTGGCLILTSAVLLAFYVKNYVDAHGRELGVLKALGMSEGRIAAAFWVFGLSVLAGCLLGFVLAFAYMPRFYAVQNADGLFPDMAVRLHPGLIWWEILLPSLCFAGLAVFCAARKLRRPALELLRGKQEISFRPAASGDLPFLKDLRRQTLRRKKVLAFLVTFSAFCFSAMTQMSLSMFDLASTTFAWMILTIGLILAFVTLMLSLSSVVRANAGTIAMMRAFGYPDSACSAAVLGGYRPLSWIGFAVGTIYQYGLLKLVMTFVFAGVEGMPAYSFNFWALALSLVLFAAVYELILYRFSKKLNALPLRAVMI